MRALVNPAYDPAAVPAPSSDALAFHRGARRLRADAGARRSAAACGSRTSRTGSGCRRSRCSARRGRSSGRCARTRTSTRWSRPARATTGAPSRTSPRCAGCAAASSCRRARSPARREAIAGEGAEVVDGRRDLRGGGRAGRGRGRAAGLLRARRRRRVRPGALGDRRLRDAVRRARGRRSTSCWCPVGVGSLGAAAARWGAQAGAAVIARRARRRRVPDRVAGRRRAGRRSPTPGTAMAGLDCAEVSEAAWPSLRAGIRGTVTVSDAEARAAMRELAAARPGDRRLRRRAAGRAARAALRPGVRGAARRGRRRTASC